MHEDRWTWCWSYAQMNNWRNQRLTIAESAHIFECFTPEDVGVGQICTFLTLLLLLLLLLLLYSSLAWVAIIIIIIIIIVTVIIIIINHHFRHNAFFLERKWCSDNSLVYSVKSLSRNNFLRRKHMGITTTRSVGIKRTEANTDITRSWSDEVQPS